MLKILTKLFSLLETVLSYAKVLLIKIIREKWHFCNSKNEITYESLSESKDTRNAYSTRTHTQLLYSVEIKQSLFLSLSLFEFHLISHSIRFVKVIKLQRNGLRIPLLVRGKL